MPWEQAGQESGDGEGAGDGERVKVAFVKGGDESGEGELGEGGTEHDEAPSEGLDVEGDPGHAETAQGDGREGECGWKEGFQRGQTVWGIGKPDGIDGKTEAGGGEATEQAEGQALEAVGGRGGIHGCSKIKA